MKVCYLTWGETPRSYGVYGSQVIKQFVYIHKLFPKSPFEFLAALPIINSGLIREKWRYPKQIHKIRQFLDDIPFSILPIWAPQNFVDSTKKSFPYMHKGVHQLLKNQLLAFQPDIVHCRSYHAAWAALQVREKYKFNYKVLFDARGLWPEEVALRKKWDNENPNYLHLKTIEKYILNNADKVIAVSTPMALHYKGLGAKDVRTIYLSALVEQFTRKETYVRPSSSDGIVTFIYVGALADSTWHKINPLLDLYKHLRARCKKTKLIIVTTSNHITIKKAFTDIPSEELEITSAKNANEVAALMHKAHIGVMAYYIPRTDLQRRLATTVMAVKTAEYLASGLPILVNKFCKGAAEVVEDAAVGIAFIPNSYQEITDQSLEKLLNESTSLKAQRIAQESFSYEANAQKYATIYEELMN